MLPFVKNRVFTLLCRVILAGVFIFASWHKAMHPELFAISVRSYQILPVSLSNLFALGVSWGEMLAGVMLLAGVLIRPAAGALMLLLGVFIAAIVTVLVKGLVIDCGCFGPGGHSSLVSPWMLIRNVLLLAAAWVVIRYNDGSFSLWPGDHRHGSATS